MLTKFKIDRLRTKVRVRVYGYGGTLSDKEADEINDWVETTQCGYRVSWDSWKLKSKDAVLMFILRWGA